MENTIIKKLKNKNILLYQGNYIYSYDEKNKNISKEFHIDINEKNGNDKDDHIYESMNELIFNLNKNIGNCKILIWKSDELLALDKLINFFSNNSKKENIISDNFSFNFIKNEKVEKSNNTNIINKNKNELNEVSSDNLLLYTDDNTLTSSRNNNSLFNDNLILNNNNKVFKKEDSINISPNKNKYIESDEEDEENKDEDIEIEEEEEEEEEENSEYVYISRTGSKYHGSPQCGRMKVSTCVSLREAESLGLEPCMKCY